jgi:hypothetical protein
VHHCKLTQAKIKIVGANKLKIEHNLSTLKQIFQALKQQKTQ